jgi:hypothetical protein
MAYPQVYPKKEDKKDEEDKKDKKKKEKAYAATSFCLEWTYVYMNYSAALLR